MFDFVKHHTPGSDDDQHRKILDPVIYGGVRVKKHAKDLEYKMAKMMHEAKSMLSNDSINFRIRQEIIEIEKRKREYKETLPDKQIPFH